MSWAQIRQESNKQGFQQSRMVPDAVFWSTRKNATVQTATSAPIDVVSGMTASSQVSKQAPKPKPIGQEATLKAKRKTKAAKNRRHRLNKLANKLRQETLLEAYNAKKNMGRHEEKEHAEVLSMSIPKDTFTNAKAVVASTSTIELTATSSMGGLANMGDVRGLVGIGLGRGYRPMSNFPREVIGRVYNPKGKCNGKCVAVPPFEMCAPCSEADFQKRFALRHTKNCDGGCFQDPPFFQFCEFCADKLERGVECYGTCLTQDNRKMCNICIKREDDLEKDAKRRFKAWESKMFLADASHADEKKLHVNSSGSVSVSVSQANQAPRNETKTKETIQTRRSFSENAVVDTERRGQLKDHVYPTITSASTTSTSSTSVEERRLPLTRDLMRIVKTNPNGIIKKVTPHVIQIGNITVPNTCHTRVLAKSIDKSCNFACAHGLDWKSEYRRKFYKECTMPIARPADVESAKKNGPHASRLAYNVKSLTSDELYLFALVLPQVYADWNSDEATYWHGNQLLLAGADLVTELDLRGNPECDVQERQIILPPLVGHGIETKTSRQMDARIQLINHLFDYFKKLIGGESTLRKHSIDVRDCLAIIQEAVATFNGTEESLYAAGRSVMKGLLPILHKIYLDKDYAKGLVTAVLLEDAVRYSLHPNPKRDEICLSMSEHECGPTTCGQSHWVDKRPAPRISTMDIETMDSPTSFPQARLDAFVKVV